MKISQAAIDAAHLAYCGNDTDAISTLSGVWEDKLREVLQAAAPHIIAANAEATAKAWVASQWIRQNAPDEFELDFIEGEAYILLWSGKGYAPEVGTFTSGVMACESGDTWTGYTCAFPLKALGV
jgi:hypothetical protein